MVMVTKRRDHCRWLLRSRLALSRDTQCDVDCVLRRGNRVLASGMSERCRVDNFPCRGTDPIGSVRGRRQVEGQSLFVGGRHNCIDVWLELAMVMVKGILFPALTHAAVKRAGGHATYDKTTIWLHF